MTYGSNDLFELIENEIPQVLNINGEIEKKCSESLRKHKLEILKSLLILSDYQKEKLSTEILDLIRKNKDQIELILKKEYSQIIDEDRKLINLILETYLNKGLKNI